jgi:hypothetical protein
MTSHAEVIAKIKMIRASMNALLVELEEPLDVLDADETNVAFTQIVDGVEELGEALSYLENE